MNCSDTTSSNDTALTYDKIRFIGYAIPTTPAQLVSIGDPNGPGAVAGVNLGLDDAKADIDGRIAVMKNAVDLALSKIPAGEQGVINVFMIPEFYFHGPLGPYVYADEADNPLLYLRSALTSTFDATTYPNWMFLCGSAIVTNILDLSKALGASSVRTRNAVVSNLAQQWLTSFGPLKGVLFDSLVNFIKVCHSYPACEVQGQCTIISNIPIRTPEVDQPTNLMSTEKYFVSNEDFLLYDVTGKDVITEQMTAYPPIDLSAGDAKKSAFDKYAIFRQNQINPANPIQTTVMDYGVEICLDHSDVRLRRNIDNEPILIGGIHVQLIPSCGMQISLASVATDAGGFVFNCDGQYALNENASGAETINDVDCVYANYRDSSNAIYAAHTQFARVVNPAIGGDPNAAGSSNATFATPDASVLTVYPVTIPASLQLGTFFAGGPGQLDIYGLATPFVLYP